MRRPPALPRAPPTYPQGCLLQRLSACRLADLPFLLPAPDKCTTEHTLAVQVRDVRCRSSSCRTMLRHCGRLHIGQL